MTTPKFYIGQKVVAVKDHSQGAFKSGEEFVVTGVYPCKCACKIFAITIGIDRGASFQRCGRCGTRMIEQPTSEWWFNETCFAPVIEKFQAITFEKIMEEELTSVN